LNLIHENAPSDGVSRYFGLDIRSHIKFPFFIPKKEKIIAVFATMISLDKALLSVYYYRISQSRNTLNYRYNQKFDTSPSLYLCAHL